MKLLKIIFGLIKQTFVEWQEDNASLLAAALAYYTIFSLAPLLIIAISLAGFIWSRSAIESQVLQQMEELLGPQGTIFIQSILDNASENFLEGGGIFATMIGVGVMIFGAIGVFRQLRNALNLIWDVDPPEKKGIWKTAKSILLRELLSFTMVMSVGFLLVVSLLLSTILSVLGDFLINFIPLPNVIMTLINYGTTLLILTLVFSLLFKYLPQTTVAWKDVLLGGAVTAVLFTLGKYLIGLYLGNSSVAAIFGAAGSLALLLVWVYYSAQIIYLGAEFTQVYANRFGSNIPKNKRKSKKGDEMPDERGTHKQNRIPQAKIGNQNSLFMWRNQSAPNAVSGKSPSTPRQEQYQNNEKNNKNLLWAAEEVSTALAMPMGFTLKATTPIFQDLVLINSEPRQSSVVNRNGNSPKVKGLFERGIIISEDLVNSRPQVSILVEDQPTFSRIFHVKETGYGFRWLYSVFIFMRSVIPLNRKMNLSIPEKKNQNDSQPSKMNTFLPEGPNKTVLTGLDWGAAFQAGLIGGLIMLLISIILPWVVLGDPFLIVRIMASVLLGPQFIPHQSGLVPGVYLVAFLTHFTLSLFFAVLITLVIHRWGIVVAFLGGAVMGLMIYFMNFFTFSTVFPWLLPYHNWMLLTAHVFFGAMVGSLYELFEDENLIDEPLFRSVQLSKRM